LVLLGAGLFFPVLMIGKDTLWLIGYLKVIIFTLRNKTRLPKCS